MKITLIVRGMLCAMLLASSTGLVCMDPFQMTPLEIAAQASKFDEFDALLKNYARVANPVTGLINPHVQTAVNRFGTNSRGMVGGYFNGPMVDAGVRLITGILLGNGQQVNQALSDANINTQPANQGWVAGAASRIMTVMTMTAPLQRFLNGTVNGIRPLFAAVGQGNVPIAALLIYYGANYAVTEVDAAGRTLDQVAALSQNPEMTALITQVRFFMPNSMELRNHVSGIAAHAGFTIGQPQVVVVQQQHYIPVPVDAAAQYGAYPGVPAAADPTAYAQQPYAYGAPMYQNIDPTNYHGANPYGAGYNPAYQDPSYHQ